MSTTMSTSFTALGSGNALAIGHKKLFNYAVSGTFSGTVILESSSSAGTSFEPVMSFTAAASGTLIAMSPNEAPIQFRFRCSAFTSGTIVTSIVDRVSDISSVKNADGVEIFAVSDDTVRIKGASDGSSSAAGYVGEKISQTKLRSAAAAMTTATPLNVTASPLSLTAGRYEIYAIVGVLPGATTSITTIDVGISTTSATLSGADTIGVQDVNGQVRIKDSRAAFVPGANDLTQEIPLAYISVNQATTLYLVAQAAFTVSTLSVYGSIVAIRRV